MDNKASAVSHGDHIHNTSTDDTRWWVSWLNGQHNDWDDRNKAQNMSNDVFWGFGMFSFHW